MKILIILLYFLSCTTACKAQYENEYGEIDRIALTIAAAQTNTTADIAAYIQSHFNTDTKKVRAIYTWVANNIQYSSDSMHRVILNEDRYEKVSFAFRRKKGVCENFAAIFDDICMKSGLKSYIIEGYTRFNRLKDETGHAWNAVFVDNRWYLYDPTWDAGFEKNGQIIGQSGTQYFQVAPQDFIQSHMPFDPMFQFVDYPLTYQEFNKGIIRNNSKKSYFNYKDSLAVYEKQDSLSQYIATSSRIKQNGIPSTMIGLKLSQLKLETEIVYQDKDANLYNSAVADYTAAVARFRDFLNYRNNRFSPAKPADEIGATLDGIEKQIAAASEKLMEVNRSKATLLLNTGDVESMLSGLLAQVKTQQAFLKDYFSTAKEN